MISIVSDTHMPARADEMPEDFWQRVEKSDLTVHCGDFEARDVLERFEDRTQKLVAVKGNCDRFSINSSATFERKGYRFGVYHGSGINPRGHRPTLLDIAENKLRVDVLIHGHTHQQEAALESGVLLLNPGSATGVGGGSASPGNPKMMELDAEPGRMNVRRIEFDGKPSIEVEEFSL